MNNLLEKVSYLKGLAEGMKISDASKEGKLIHHIIGVLGEFADEFEMVYDEIDDMGDQLDELEDYTQAIDEGLEEIEEEIFDEDYYGDLNLDYDDLDMDYEDFDYCKYGDCDTIDSSVKNEEYLDFLGKETKKNVKEDDKCLGDSYCNTEELEEK